MRDLIDEILKRAPLFEEVMRKGKRLCIQTYGKNLFDDREALEPYSADYICFEDSDGNWYVVFPTFNGRICMCKLLTQRIVKRNGKSMAEIDWSYVEDELIFAAFRGMSGELIEQARERGFEQVYAVGPDNDPTQLLVFVKLSKISD